MHLTSNMNAEELKKAIKTAMKKATMESSEKTKAVDERKNTVKKIKEQIDTIYNLLEENFDEELPSDKLIKILKMYQEEEKRLKNIFKVN